MNTEDKIFEEYRQRVKDKVDAHEVRINNHSVRLDKLEQNSVALDEKVKALIDKMDGLITTIRWASGFFIGGIVAFFFYAIQQGVFK